MHAVSAGSVTSVFSNDPRSLFYIEIVWADTFPDILLYLDESTANLYTILMSYTVSLRKLKTNE